MKDKKIIKIQNEVDKFIIKTLSSIKDNIKQFSAYLYYIVFHQYFKEILIGYDFQYKTFPNKNIQKIILDVARKNTKQHFDITRQQLQEVREGLWKEVLEVAKGNEKEAWKLYCSDEFKPTYRYVK
jgi:ferritin-like protein